MKKIAVLMGSDSDFPKVEPALKILKAFGIPTQVRVMSCHRTPAVVKEFSENALKNGYGAIIAAAGKAAHIAGVIAAHTILPVIGIPISSTTLDGMDALLSMVQMPPGVPVATVAINGAENAAYLAVQILALSDDSLAKKLVEHRIKMTEDVIAKDLALQKRLVDNP